MISYLNDYVSNTEYDYINKKLNNNIKELFYLNKNNIILNLNYLKSLDLNIFDIINKRNDLLICNIDVLKEKIKKVENIIKKINVDDYILFGI